MSFITLTKTKFESRRTSDWWRIRFEKTKTTYTIRRQNIELVEGTGDDCALITLTSGKKIEVDQSVEHVSGFLLGQDGQKS
ncbi:flagellar FlbD family protein [Salmonella enterica]|nr:flagellar FlbD family protein [Salmonella enterica]